MKKGFTLVEVLIVLVVIGIILAVILPNTLRAIEQANVRDAAATLRSIDTAIGVCYSRTRNWALCNTAGALTAPADGSAPYIDAIPAADAFGVAYAIIAGAGGGFESNKVAHFPAWPLLDPHN